MRHININTLKWSDLKEKHYECPSHSISFNMFLHYPQCRSTSSWLWCEVKLRLFISTQLNRVMRRHFCLLLCLAVLPPLCSASTASCLLINRSLTSREDSQLHRAAVLHSGILSEFGFLKLREKPDFTRFISSIKCHCSIRVRDDR